MAKKERKKAAGNTGQEWIATYSDTVTLLLTFFILLYSFSSIDAQRFKQISNAFQNVLSGQGGSTIFDGTAQQGDVQISAETKLAMDKAEAEEAKRTFQEVKKYLEENNLDESIDVKEDKRGTILEVKGSILFETGRSDILPSSMPIMEKINKLISSINHPIIIEGHTDNRPIHNDKYASNWELSTARAVNVLRYFVDTKGHDPKKFSAAGYAEFKPILPNDTEENMAKNRRVNIIIVTNQKERIDK